MIAYFDTSALVKKYILEAHLISPICCRFLVTMERPRRDGQETQTEVCTPDGVS